MIKNIKFIERNVSRTLKRVKDSVYTITDELDAEVYKTREPVSFENRKSGKYQIIKKGEKWGDLWDCG